jgi:predicted nuclease of restriction endonuclease-like (RecB) superfamily
LEKSYYIKFINELKQEILSSRLQAAKLVNKELLLLYFKIGKRISHQINMEGWGAKVISTISQDLQKKLPGLRGFSSTNLKYMKQFFEAYAFLEQSTGNSSQRNSSKKHQIGQSQTDQFDARHYRASKGSPLEKNSIFLPDFLALFFGVSFTHHYKIISSFSKFEERFYYLKNASEQSWSISTLDYHLETKTHKRQGKIQNNFKSNLPPNIEYKAIQAFRDELMLDFINIQDPNNIDEREIEQGIVNDVKRFLLTLGKEFTYIGNQYRLVVNYKEYFVDLLFFHRGLRCLVAVDLKSGEFKPEYTGKMSFYLNVLNKQVKLNDENPSVGIILCKEKDNAIVEYSFVDNKKPIGVGTYTFSKKMPQKLKKYLPPSEELINVVKEAEETYLTLKLGYE